MKRFLLSSLLVLLFSINAAAQAPTISSLAPNTGHPSGGTTVTITGTSLTGATAVLFGATPATSFIVSSDMQIIAVSPPGTGTISVTVTTPGGTSNAFPYVYAVPASATTVESSPDPSVFGQTVTITATVSAAPLLPARRPAP